MRTADQETIALILGTEYTEANIREATKFLERFAYSTTALAAIAAALDELDASTQADFVREACEGLALIEAAEL